MNKTKFVVSLLSVSLLFAGLTACGGPKEQPVDFSFSIALESGVTSVKVGETDQIVITVIEASDFDPENPIEREYTYESSDASVLSVDQEGLVTGVAMGPAIVTVYESTEDVTRTLGLNVLVGDPLDGAASYSDSIADKTEILGKLEKYAMDESLTGISLFENGGYVMYNPRVQKGVETYITGYGFGILAEGNITADLASETKAEWKRYYHSGSASDPKNINQLDAQGAEVSDLGSYISSAYWGTKMNANKNGYDWYPSLAKDSRPIGGTYDAKTSTFTPAADQSKKASWFKFHVRTGASDDVEFRTLSSKAAYAAYDHTPVTINDYVDAFKVLLTQSFGLYRGAELAADTSYSIVGASEYFEATADAAGIDDAAFANNVNLFTGNDAEGDYLVVNMTSRVTPFYAMYGLSSALYQPISRAFLSTLGDGDVKEGVKKYGTFITGTSGNLATPVDTILSLGAFTLEYWEEDKTIAFKKNDSWFENSIPGMENLYRIPGVKVAVYTGAQTDNTLVFKEFIDGKLDAAGIPTIEYIRQYRNDPRTTTTSGDSVFKLNVNSCTPERWEELFGTEGKIVKTPLAQYWDVKPWMSNKSFLKGLNFSIDRGNYAANRGRIPSNEYYSSNYMIDPENGLSWNATDAHAEAMADYYPDTFGFNLSVAKTYFRQAVSEMVTDGILELGSVANPTEISIVIEWMNPSDSIDYGEEISGYIEDAFNDPNVCENKVNLTVVNHDGTTNYEDVYTKHLQVGQFDLGFGSISGNSLDPLNFLEVLKSDNSSGFTLNWGPDTSVVSQNLVFDGRPWSFDSLWKAGDSYVVAAAGVEVPLFTCLSTDVSKLADGRMQIVVQTNELNSEDITTYLYAICLFATNDGVEYSDYTEIYAYYDPAIDTEEGGSTSSWERVEGEGGAVTYTIVFDADAVSYMETNFASFYIAGIDAYVSTSIVSLGMGGVSFDSTIYYFEAWPTTAPAPVTAPVILD